MFAPQRKPKVLETALYVEDLDRAGRFYGETFGFEPMARDNRMWALDCGAASVLLLFKQGGALDPIELPGGRIPPHDGGGPVHLAFAVEAEELDGWKSRLADCGVEIEATMKWPRGGESLYFRDPDHHLVELASPGIWANY